MKTIRIDGVVGDWMNTAEEVKWRVENIELESDEDLKKSYLPWTFQTIEYNAVKKNGTWFNCPLAVYYCNRYARILLLVIIDLH